MLSKVSLNSSRRMLHVCVPIRSTPKTFHRQRSAVSNSPFSTRHFANPSTRFSISTPVKGPETVSAALRAPSIILNPPASARTPPLTLPTRSPSQSTFSYCYALGKAYVKFYKSGIVAIYHNYKLSRGLRARIAPATVDEAVKQGFLTRAEYQLLRRNRQDVRKIPLFALMYLVCGEFTPLLVVALSGLVPRTLWIPQQVRATRAKISGRRARAYEIQQSPPASAAASSAPPGAADTVTIGQILGAYPLWWDRLPVTPSWFIQRRVQRRLEEVELDDFAIERDGGMQSLEEEETRLAADFRGLDGSEKDHAVLKRQLKSWLDAKKKRSITTLILEGPSAWATR